MSETSKKERDAMRFLAEVSEATGCQSAKVAPDVLARLVNDVDRLEELEASARCDHDAISDRDRWIAEAKVPLRDVLRTGPDVDLGISAQKAAERIRELEAHVLHFETAIGAVINDNEPEPFTLDSARRFLAEAIDATPDLLRGMADKIAELEAQVEALELDNQAFADGAPWCSNDRVRRRMLVAEKRVKELKAENESLRKRNETADDELRMVIKDCDNNAVNVGAEAGKVYRLLSFQLGHVRELLDWEG